MTWKPVAAVEFSERALILDVGRFKEADLWIRFLSPSRGILSAFAFGGSRSRRRLSGCLDVFNDVLFSIKTTRNGTYNALQEGTLMTSPRRLRTDWRRLGIAVNCAKFVEAFGVAPDGSGAAHALLTDVLAMLEDEASLPVNVPLLFRARFVFSQGYAVGLENCAVCGNALRAARRVFFRVKEGHFVCSSCFSRSPGPGDLRDAFSEALFGVCSETLDALAHVQEYSPLAWREGALVSLSPAGQRECARVVDAFIEHHVGLYWDASRFVRV
jgi:DNA repair protein RecO (recombination protein O)